MAIDILGHISPRVVYVTDAYCGWCYGFAPKLHAFHAANRAEVSFDVVSGGLFTGDRRRPIREYGHIPEANERIIRLTGVRFGEPYQELLREGSFVLDSEAAAAGLVALRDQAPEQGIELVGAMQTAFYGEGRSLSDPETFAAIAQDFGLNAAHATHFMVGDEGRAAAQKDFALAAALGAHSYPTLLLVKDGQVHKLPGIGGSVEATNERLRSLLVS